MDGLGIMITSEGMSFGMTNSTAVPTLRVQLLAEYFHTDVLYNNRYL